MFRFTIFIGFILGMLVAGCVENTENSDQKQRKEQERLSEQSHMSVGMPAIVNFQEKRVLKNILELRDTEIKTITYTQDMNGILHKLCDSIGYGVPYGTQYTNPMRLAGHDNSGYALVAIPQADPNGLFSPPTAEGTWVLCFNKETKNVSPIYVEPRIIVSPFALK